MNTYRLLRHPLNTLRFAVLAGLSAGLCMQQAAATDEVVVNGAEVAAQARAEREMVEAQLQEYMRTLNRELREAFEATIEKPQLAPTLQLSTIEVSTRG